MSTSPDIATYLFTQGVLGIVCLVLGYVSLKLYNRVQQLQDARLQDAKDTTRDVAAVLSANTQSNLLLAEKIETAKRGGA